MVYFNFAITMISQQLKDTRKKMFDEMEKRL